MHVNTVIFDLDGTLLDTSQGIIASLQEALRRMGQPELSMDVIRKFIGPPLVSAFEQYAGFDQAMAQEAVRLYRERYGVKGVYECTPYPGVPELLRDLKAAGKRVAVATAKPGVYSERALQGAGLWPYIDQLSAVRLTDKHDRKAELIAQALRRQPGPAVMVGDRSFDMLGAKACGIPCIGVLYGFGTEQELRDSGATVLAADAAALHGLLLEE